MPRTPGISLSWAWCGVLCFPLFLLHLPGLVPAQPNGYLIANPSTTWNSDNLSDSHFFSSGGIFRIILYSSSNNTACGFFCIERCNRYLFAIFNYTFCSEYECDYNSYEWTANQKNPVSFNATLQLSSERGLVLRDSDGTTAWSTNIGNKSVAGLILTDTGHLVLLDKNNATIWQSFDHPTDSLVLWPSHGYLKAKPSTSWTNTLSTRDYVKFRDGSTVKIMLYSGSSGPVFACGFVCNEICNNYLFAIFVLYIDADIIEDVSPQVVWSANQKNPVSINATLQLSSERGLVLQDANGTTVWSTDIGTKSVAGLNFTDTGKLMLLNQNNETIWQSFDHPTDLLLPGQKLMVRQRLTSSVPAKYQIEGGLFSLYLSREGLFAFIESNASDSEQYFSFNLPNTSYIQFQNGSFAFFTDPAESYPNNNQFKIPSASSLQYMRFEPDGHLRVYEWNQMDLKWTEVADLLKTDKFDNCSYPTVCGTYGICRNGQCSCPLPENETNYFKQVVDGDSASGRSLIAPISCESPQNWHILELENVTFFNHSAKLENVHSDFCKQACLKNCSCKAATFIQESSGSPYIGSCSLQSQVYSLMNAEMMFDAYYYSVFTAYIKVQNVSSAVPLSPGSVPSREETNLLKPVPQTTQHSKLMKKKRSVTASLTTVFYLKAKTVLFNLK